MAGSLSAVAAAAGEVKAWVEDPMLTLKPCEQWTKTLPRARINSQKSEWYKICGVLYELGIIEAIRLEDIFHVQNAPVLNGAFAVEKKGRAGVGQSRVTRVRYHDFIPANCFQRLMAGDLNTLSSVSAWSHLILDDDQVLLWSGGDQKGAFYAWELPPAWRPFMAFAWPVPGHLVRSSRPWEYVASSVISMGWIQAISLFQHLHRTSGMNPYPAGAGHPEELEWRRDRPAPQASHGLTLEFVQFYFDDFDCPEIVSSGGWEQLPGTMSEAHKRQREAYSRRGVGISEDKAHVREPRVVRIEVDGVGGTVAVPKQKHDRGSLLWYLVFGA